MKTVKFVLEKTSTGYSASSQEYDILVNGQSIEEAQDNAAVALKETNSEAVEGYKLEFSFE